jgi:pimeloyl-ACP methyl ester carboxylesterase
MEQERTIELKDGRVLGVAEFGDPAGRPVVYHHGFPGSRLDYALLDPEDVARSSGVRIIALDRPGSGLSSPRPGRSLLDQADDVAAAVDALGVDRFALLGFSGGAPFAAACAYALPSRVTSLALVSGMGPAHAPGMKDGLSWTLAGRSGLVRRLILWLMDLGLSKDPDKFLARSLGTMPPPDRALLEQDAGARLFLAGLAEAFRNGRAGAHRDGHLYKSPWGFELGDIAVRTSAWHATEDANVPVSVGRFAAAQIPGCVEHIVEGEAHLSIVRGRLGGILEELVG